MARKEANFSDHVMKSINDFRKEGFLCDVTLNVRGVPFTAHRNVLAASSPYFKAFFTSEMKENQDNTIEIKDLNTQIMEDILTYLYSGTVVLTESNAIELTVAADYMLLPKLKQMATEFVIQNLTAVSCLGVLSIAEKYDFKDLCEEAQKYILDNFASVSQGEDFEKLSVEQLIAIISCDDLVAKEMEVFEAIVRWTNLQIEERKKHFDVLFSHVRLIFLPRRYILDVVKEESLVKNSESCGLALKKTDEFLDSSSDERQKMEPPFKPRTCQNGVLLLGGWLETNKITDTAQVFVPYLAEFFDLAPMLFPRKNHGVAVHEGFVYVVGGSSVQESAVQSVEMYDPRSNTWSTVMPLRKESAGLGVVCHESYIYAIGGHDAIGQHLDVVQRYDLKRNTWEFMEPMIKSRTDLCTVAAETLIYAFGGFSMEEYMPLNTCECYDPESNKWYMKAPMQNRRTGASAAYINQKIYVVGGQDVLDIPYVLDACEIYTPETNTWSSVAPMCVARSHAGAAFIKDRLFVFGGVNKGRELHGVEYYDTVKYQWEVFTRLKMGMEGLACCVITVPGELLTTIL